MTAINTAIAVISKPKLNKEYKRVLTTANQDRLKLDNVIVLSGDWFYETLFTSNVESNINSPFTYEAGGDWNTNLTNNYASGRLIIVFDDGQSVNFSTIDTIPRTGTFKMMIKKVGLDVSVYVDDVLKDTKTLSSEVDYKIDTFGNILANRFFNGSFFWVNINGNMVSLNEGNGTSFKSDDGTITGECETIHLNGVNYINIDMIKSI